MRCAPSRLCWILTIFAMVFLVGLAGRITGSNAIAASPDTCEAMTPLPFAGRASGQDAWQLLHAGGAYCVKSGGQMILTDDVIPLSVERLGERLIIAGRRRISGHLAILSVSGNDEPRALEMTFDQRSKLHLEAMFPLGGKVFLLAYDVSQNLPSGRRREKPSEAHGLFSVKMEENEASFSLIEESFLSAGLEAGVLTSVNNGKVWLCLAAKCSRYGPAVDGAPVLETSAEIAFPGATARVIELVSDEFGNGFALAGLGLDDRTQPMPASEIAAYHLCNLTPEPVCTALARNEVPYRLRLENGKPRWDAAVSRRDAQALFVFDLTRAGLNGVANFAENNLEGRLAWSQSYYLNGLLSALELSGDLAYGGAVQTDIRNRYLAEVDELAALIEQPYPGLLSKRYSLDREPVVSLLHNARIFKAIWRGFPILDAQLRQRFQGLNLGASHNDDAFEFFGEARGLAVAIVKKHMPFWADGADLPWNARSAWIEGIAWSPDPDGESRTVAASLAQDFITGALRDKPDKWPYAAGNLSPGWTAKDNVSANTPVFAGDTSNPNGAHISYRSMDGLALLAAFRAGLVEDKDGVTAYLAGLVERGLLYPFVNEEFHRLGNARAIPFSASRFYARASLPWEIGNMPWSLMSLPDG